MAGAEALNPPRCRRSGVDWLLLASGLLVGGCQIPSSGPLTIWAVEERAALDAHSPPQAETTIFSAAERAIRLSAAVNETVAFQLALRTSLPRGEVFDVALSDFAGNRSTLRARDVAELFRVHPVGVTHFSSWYPARTGRPAVPLSVPDLLVPWNAPRGGPVRLDSTATAIVWIDLHVPPGTPPDVYTSRLTLTPAGGANPAYVFAVELHVRPVALPGAHHLPIVCRIDPTDLLARHLHWPHEAPETTRLYPGEESHRAAIELVNETMRLFHDHRLTPVLWASFPKVRLVGERDVEVDWQPYDRLVSGWMNGDAFADRVGVARCLVPASLRYPDAARNGGLDSPRYARLLAAYLAECRRHFQERGWLDRAVLRLSPPDELSRATLAALRRGGEILRQSECGLPLLAHLPPRSLRGLGWYAAPPIDLPDVTIWAPPAAWWEPAALRRERNLGREAWITPGNPPYSGTLSLAGLSTDATILPWQAFRYDLDGLWIENAAAPVGDSAAATGDSVPLVYPGVDFGVTDRPLPSLRLKRLRRGAQDYELLRLLDRRGSQLLARRIAAQMVRWAGTDTCEDNLLSCKEPGWPADARLLALAHELLLDELAGTFAQSAVRDAQRLENLAAWARLMSQARQVQAAVRGVHLEESPDGLQALALVSVSNQSEQVIRGTWRLVNPPLGWSVAAPVACQVRPGERSLATISWALDALSYNTQGVYPFELQFDAEGVGVFRVPARLAVMACPRVDRAPTVDGDLSDWSQASSNAAGDFRLVLAPRDEDGRAPEPSLPTQAFVGMDDDCLYVALRCGVAPGETPTWLSDNRVPLDGAVPWGQDVVEIILNPRNTHDGTPADLYLLQIKPSGALLAFAGCPTDPPLAPAQPWTSGARAAVKLPGAADAARADVGTAARGAAAGQDVWTLEVSVPLDALGPAARQQRVWGFNITRLDARRGEYSSWSGARGLAYLPQSTGNLVLLRP